MGAQDREGRRPRCSLGMPARLPELARSTQAARKPAVDPKAGEGKAARPGRRAKEVQVGRQLKKGSIALKHPLREQQLYALAASNSQRAICYLAEPP
jgi:hypothetical protein